MAEPLVAAGFDDVLLDNLVTLGTAFSAQQVGLSAGVGFVVARDLMQPPDQDQLKASPWVVFSVNVINPSQKGGSRQLQASTYTLDADLYVAGFEVVADVEGGDQKARARLSYLKEQVRALIWSLNRQRLGFVVGTIGDIRPGRFQVYSPPETGQEAWIIGGRWSVDIDATWTPEDIAGVALTDVSVNVKKNQGPDLTASRWSGLYSP